MTQPVTMSELCELGYKTCRKNAGLTQESAAEALHIGVRTLAAYENGEMTASDMMVEAMTELYDTPLLAWWHLKHASPLGKYLPDVQIPQTNGDMAFQTIMAGDGLTEVVRIIKVIMEDGKITPEEVKMLSRCTIRMREIDGKIMSAVLYNEQLLRQTQ